jgi:hypothetical protein
MRLIFFMLMACAGGQALADPAVGANVSFTSCTVPKVLNTSSTGNATYTFGPGDCAGNGFTAVTVATGENTNSLAEVYLVNYASVNMLRFARTVVSGTPASVVEGRLFSTSGVKFQLTSITIYPINANSQTLTVTAYSGGVAVSGSTITINYTMTAPGHGTTLTSTDFGSHYNNIDEIDVASSTTFGVAISNIQTATPVALPLTLTDFSGQRSGNDVLLQWTTASEQNTSHFDIQRGIDGIDYNSVGAVAAAGNSNVQLHYSYTDPLPATAASQYFYRLQMVDLDGNFTYSPVLRITGSTQTPVIQVYPNPFRNQTQLVFNSPSAGTAQLTVTDMAGRLLLTGSLPVPQGNTVIPIPMLATLPKGVYALRIVFGGTNKSQLIVKTQ